MAQLGALGARVDGLDTQMLLLDQRLASSTAVAVALGGAVMLPNRRFNLTANLATYDGAQAGSVQMNALISDSIAINAGVATGFNKHGQTAGRVGVTVGW
jgi:hypothetical protein